MRCWSFLPLLFGLLLVPGSSGTAESSVNTPVPLDRQIHNQKTGIDASLSELRDVLSGLRIRWDAARASRLDRDALLLVLREAERLDRQSEALAHKAARLCELSESVKSKGP